MGLSTLLYAIPPLSKELSKVEKGLKGTYLDSYIQGMCDMVIHGTFLFVMVYAIMETDTMLTFLYSQRPHDMDISTYQFLLSDKFRYVAYLFIYLNSVEILYTLLYLTGGRDIP